MITRPKRKRDQKGRFLRVSLPLSVMTFPTPRAKMSEFRVFFDGLPESRRHDLIAEGFVELKLGRDKVTAWKVSKVMMYLCWRWEKGELTS